MHKNVLIKISMYKRIYYVILYYFLIKTCCNNYKGSKGSIR
jgi:hypothetical protein